MRTHPVDKLLEQHCYKSAAGLLQLVRFYVCRKDPGWGWSRDFTKIDCLRGGGGGGGQSIKLHASTKKRYTSITRSGLE